MLPRFSVLLLLSQAVAGALPLPPDTVQQPLYAQVNEPPNGISVPFFASVERLARLVDIAYCVGTTGLSRPFECASRCKDFPTLDLVTTWNTGVLMSDSCGYIAVDHGANLQPEPTAKVYGSDVSAVDKKHGAIIVAFRGTYSITNTVVDLSTVPQEYVPYPSPDDGGDQPPGDPKHNCDNCTVHMGFLASWKIAREDVLPTLKPLRTKYPDYPIYLVGHSLGGAVAALAALEMNVALGWDNLVVTTFGEPRVGNEGFVRFLNGVFDLAGESTDVEKQTYRRLTHVDDPVPLLPLSEWGFRSHAGEIFISKSDLSPSPEDIWSCVGDYDPNCIAGSEGETLSVTRHVIAARDPQSSLWSSWIRKFWGFPSRLKLWQLLFAHRDYFWRLGVCVPGGDPLDWGRDRYPNISSNDEL
ncbi:Alpha/Beta hydrolase protein [Pseudomassariella vexata]|uniref:Alpha/Beta hydrolase protein n=1 Tax=Pseudomassariella vexata TaxID=1141098 RepID=A0A1Y2E4J6_9PEZI|nr:Alpha/Beta hydrolase protein [Pseudomassariella vexata]ORY66439.1 Alpha/Beta hydrolase protein [Pseudomassariella vexata]